jgi:hypothetical protein
MRNNINTYADLTAYNADTNKDFPNISYIQGTDEVKWVKEDPTLVTLTLTTDRGTTALLATTITNFSKMWVDGVEQESVVGNYTFQEAGNHIVKYKLIDPSKIIQDSFKSCSWLKTITVQNTVTLIDKNAFKGCNNLESITINATTPPSLNYGPTDQWQGAFYNTNNCPIYVPSESVDTYKATAYWVILASRIRAIPTT